MRHHTLVTSAADRSGREGGGGGGVSSLSCCCCGGGGAPYITGPRPKSAICAVAPVGGYPRRLRLVPAGGLMTDTPGPVSWTAADPTTGIGGVVVDAVPQELPASQDTRGRWTGGVFSRWNGTTWDGERIVGAQRRLEKSVKSRNRVTCPRPVDCPIVIVDTFFSFPLTLARSVSLTRRLSLSLARPRPRTDVNGTTIPRYGPCLGERREPFGGARTNRSPYCRVQSVARAPTDQWQCDQQSRLRPIVTSW